jgi:hypothetical protein
MRRAHLCLVLVVAMIAAQTDGQTRTQLYQWTSGLNEGVD